jgi:WD40 repeat protein/serine/threonine protein kinase
MNDEPVIDETLADDRCAEPLDAGLAAAFRPDTAAFGHSVLKKLGKNLRHVPCVVLHEEEDGEAPLALPRSSEIPKTDSRYQLHGEIARGGMGAILKGRDVDLGRDLAFKVLLEAHKDNPEIVERFIEEAQIGGQLQHPGIIPVHELGQFADKRPFFTMKLVRGETLASLLARREKPHDDQAKVLGVFEQVCQTMAYAHSRGVIHRDLKPSNVMVGAFGEVQVMDWGLAKVLAQGGIADEEKSRDKHQRDLSIIRTKRRPGTLHARVPGRGRDSTGGLGSDTQMGSVMGTPAYMPPEQALGEVDRLDERADVFGLGAILCEVLTGKPPYVRRDSTEVSRQASRGKLDDCFARLDACGADEELIDLAKHMLAPEPEKRLRNAGVVAERITEHLASVQRRLQEAELARAEAQARVEEERRRRKLHIAIAALMLVVAAGSIFAAGRFRQLAQSERAAHTETEKQLAASNILRLAAQSQIIGEKRPIQGLLLALESVELSRGRSDMMPLAHEALLGATHMVGGTPLLGHTGMVEDAVISHDGRWLATASSDATVRIWDLAAEDVRSSSRVLGHTSGVPAGAVAFHPNGRWLITGDAKGAIRIWDLTLEDPSATVRVWQGHEGAISGVAITPDGRLLATSSFDKTVRLWDLTAADPKTTRRNLPPHQDRIWQIAISPNGRWLGTSSDDKTARLFDLSADDPTEAMTELPGHEDSVIGTFFSPDGRWVATGCWDNKTRLWDLTAEDWAARPIVLVGHTDKIGWLAFSPDSRLLATCGWDKTVRLWDLTAADPSSSHVLFQGLKKNVWGVAFSPDGRWLVGADRGPLVIIWDLKAADPTMSGVALKGHDAVITNAALTPNGRWLVTSSWDTTARLWDLGVNALGISSHVLRGHRERVTSAAITPDGRRLVTGSWDRTAQIWDLTSDSPSSRSIVLPGIGRPNGGVLAISPDGRWVATGGDDFRARLWDLAAEDPSASPRILKGHTATIAAVAFSPDSRWLVTGSEDQTARVWDLDADDPTKTCVLLPDHDVAWRVAIGPRGRWVLTASGNKSYTFTPHGDSFARLWDLSADDPASSAVVLGGGEAAVQAVAISPNGRWAVTATHAKTTRVWDLEADNPAASPRVLEGRTGWTEMPISPNSRWLATGSCVWDLTATDIAASLRRVHHAARVISQDSRWLVTVDGDAAFLWDLTAEGPLSPIAVMRGHESPIHSVAISPDGRWVATGSDDHTVRLWDMDIDSLVARARRLAGRELTDEERKQYLIQSGLNPEDRP